MWRIRPHLSSSTLSARPLLPEPSLLPVSWWTTPVDTCMHASYSFSTSNTQHKLTWLSLSLSVPPSSPPTPLPSALLTVHRDCKHEHTISLSLSAPSFRARVGFKLLVWCGGAHIPGYCGREYSWLWQKLYSCDSEHSYSKVSGVSWDSDTVLIP